jgi:hypothetical protein
VSYLALSYLSCVLVFAACGPCATVPVPLLAGGAEVLGGGDVFDGVVDGDVGCDVLGLVGELGGELGAVGVVAVGDGDGCRELVDGLGAGGVVDTDWLGTLGCGEALRAGR